MIEPSNERELELELEVTWLKLQLSSVLSTLDFYATEKNWNGGVFQSIPVNDRGMRARTAIQFLKDTENGPGED